VAHNKPAHHLRLVESAARSRAVERQPPSNDGHSGVVTAVDMPASVPRYSVRRCVLCGAKHISSTTEGRIVSVQCHDCDAVFEVEYDPPDSPNVRGRIEIISRRGGSRGAD
jgi:hypothetical protein